MRAVGQAIHRARLVQRAQSVRQRRIGGLLVSVRLERREVEATRAGFQAVLSSVGAFQQMPVTEGGKTLRHRLQQIGFTARDRLETATQRDLQLAARGERLHRLRLGAERAVQRGCERERLAIHELQRVRESIDISELQGQENDATEALREDGLGIAPSPSEHRGECSVGIHGEHPPIPSDHAWQPGVVPSMQQRGASSGEGQHARVPLSRSLQPFRADASAVVSEVVVEAPLPQSAGSVEIIHSTAHGVSVRVSARGLGVAAALRRSCLGMRDSLHQERVRVSAIDVVEEDT